MLRFFVLTTLVATLVGAPAAPLQPTGKWTVDYAASNCSASRPFGPGEAPLTLSIKPAHSGGSARLVLSNAWTQLKVANHATTVDFGDGDKPFRTGAMPAMGLGPARAVVIVDLPAVQASRLRTARTIRVAASGILDREFALGPTGPLFETLDKCLADLRTYWSINQQPAQEATPATDLGRLFSWSNYPTIGGHRARTNSVTARLLIDEKGKVRDCLVTSSSGSTGLDIQTCQVFELRTVYRPALDASGEPVRSALDQTINWRR